MGGNYPNPFNPTTIINFDIANETDVRLDVYNIRGQKVTTLVNEYMKPGYHSVVWDGKDRNSKQVASGVYFYRMKADHKTLTKKMMLLK
ncbi:MAG: T9SS type A sorting domain-containing protein [Candidatus Cloacimonetes bacterium]|nr:T9SS type A sorting domain-containing protein [Candidatus Cloacimonadota bacterium]